jgi:LysM repeat protein
MKSEYHIDVTPEEDALFRDVQEIVKTEPNKKIINHSLFKSSMFWVIFGAHIAVVSVIAFASKPNFKDPVPEMVGVDDKVFLQKEEVAKPTPTPMPVDNAPMDMKPPMQEIKKTKKEATPKKTETQTNNIKNNFTQEYTVKPGDTLFSIAKKYKLSYDRLLKINNIQNPNKIQPGQKLKFL